jgi:hypothetical protein
MFYAMSASVADAARSWRPQTIIFFQVAGRMARSVRCNGINACSFQSVRRLQIMPCHARKNDLNT